MILNPDPDYEKEQIVVSKLARRTLKHEITTKGYRGIAFSFKDYSAEDFKKLRDFNSPQTIEELRKDHTFLGIVALQDPLREHVTSIMEYIYKIRNVQAKEQQNIDHYQKANDEGEEKDAELNKIDKKEQIDINVRMISGDNVDTAAVMAMQAGILNENDYHIDKQNKKSEKDEIRRQQTELVDLENQPQRELKPVYVIDAHNLQKEIFGQFLNKQIENNVKITL